MKPPYRLFGMDMSPYSVKVRAYAAYKGLDCEWVVRDQSKQEEFSKLAKLPLIPLLVDSDGAVMQDSTPMIEALETAHPDPALQPADEMLAFLSTLFEEFADEWGNKWMFHYRWTYPECQDFAAGWIANASMPQASEEERAGVAAFIKDRMTKRLGFVGSNEQTLPIIEGSFKRFTAMLEEHLRDRPFLFGARPCLADFGVYGQYFELVRDPVPAAYIKEQAPRVLDYTQRMELPQAVGGFEAWESLEATMMPMLREEVAGVFFPWTLANAVAVDSGQDSFNVTLRGEAFSQEPQKYHAKSLRVLRDKYAAVSGNEKLRAVLAESGCLGALEDA